MDVNLQVGLIAGIVSLAVSIIGVVSSLFIQRLQNLEAEKTIRASVADKLLSLRLEHYPAAFDITEKIERRKEPERILPREQLLEINEELGKWKTGTVGLLLSPESIKTFYELRGALGAGYAVKGAYSQEQADRIISLRDEFRRQLRRDLGFLYVESPMLEKQ